MFSVPKQGRNVESSFHAFLHPSGILGQMSANVETTYWNIERDKNKASTMPGAGDVTCAVILNISLRKHTSYSFQLRLMSDRTLDVAKLI